VTVCPVTTSLLRINWINTDGDSPLVKKNVGADDSDDQFSVSRVEQRPAFSG
jgi:hypothetical protein